MAMRNGRVGRRVALQKARVCMGRVFYQYGYPCLVYNKYNHNYSNICTGTIEWISVSLRFQLSISPSQIFHLLAGGQSATAPSSPPIPLTFHSPPTLLQGENSSQPPPYS